ncbi:MULTISPECIES: Crp/Fnr family transcriptional regulator [unclassified Microcoleus]|jgi:CRP-like cAMP-binding protein|uniref:Crp/Fnr family transcriptional regulator n=1 Tax=unclassified Microcoleus TaxID=2642155 RepID=UPI001D3CFD3C|nr:MULTISPECIES: Crp/Fnr family transcriptional regulator [unclassified Microcoleus]MCC3506330.1 Crp/Fnr family transcriptional regulator [Microcoleus sp. PH2017_19_SFW_U_A]TAE07456.1 MAG: Crp/Fnr family transcriptional regulator [Oscillatoriales cyanobacterium]MCC3414995.1 Crp/Fnr family transcriptional regulator [Microcoleus sp. PH2017_02_FOX_O_A]MCC3494160.1 Crp/Fnr family transcriptional regulator [Microcoleus sp. PH2017_16_JOR_D_A]MCC3519134.1 Crp/Fnr family transcriptional regulator [Mic
MLTQEQTQLITILRSLIDLTESEATQAVSLFQPQSLSRSEFFVRAGDIPQTIGFVISGILRLYYVDADGNEATKSFCAENSFVAAYSALLLGQPSRLFIQTLEDTKLLIVDYSVYRSLSESQTYLQQLNCKIAESLFIKKERRESALLLDDAKTRYLSFLEEYPGLNARLKQHYIASYLGMTPVTLSRIRTQLKNH